MECKEDGQKERLLSATNSKVERKRKTGDASGLRLALATSVPYQFPKQPMHHHQVANHAANRPITSMRPENLPFMNNMDEISYWVYTKRAPCLFNYDNHIKRREEQAQCSNAKPISVSSDKPTPKKKRKIKLIDDDSVSEKHQNVFFETPHHQNDKSGKNSNNKSVSLGSNVDFNIKSPQVKRKHKKGKNSLHKANKVVTSTPKDTGLRRSTRKKQQNSLDNFNASALNGSPDKIVNETEDNPSENNILGEKNAVNGQEKFDDDSDLTGFTANYIRSTKIQSKTTHKLNKCNKTILKNNRHSEKEKILVCVNKSMNTGTSNVLNCSSDSSQNIINLVTVKDSEVINKVDKSTSLLKFVETKGSQEYGTPKKANKRGRNNLNVSFQSKSSSASRYPKRRNNVSIPNSDEGNKHNKTNKALSHIKTPKRRKNVDHEENKIDQMISRTRSGKRIGMDMEISGKTVLMLNSTDPASSSVALNVAKVSERTDKHNQSSSRNKRLGKKQVLRQDSESDNSDKTTEETPDSLVKKSTRSGYKLRKSGDKSKKQNSQRDSLQKSGFTACFSESDSDDEPLNQRKFFC